MISWLYYSLVVSALIATSAVALELAARALGWPRRAIWAAALAAIICLPVLIPLVAPLIGARPEAVALTRGVRLPAIVISGAPGGPGTSVNDVLLMLLGAVAATGVILLVAAHLRLGRVARTWRAGVVEGVEVRISRDVGPAVYGWWRPVIVLPAWATSLDPTVRRTILAHEQAHVDANDSLLLNAARLLVALVPWNPLAWVAYRRLQLAVECDCDRRVLRRGVDASEYADTLISIGRHAVARMPRLRVALTEPSHFLSRRIAAMLTKPSRFSRLTALGGVSAGVLLLAVACMTREPLGASPEKAAQQAPRVVVSGEEPLPGAAPIAVDSAQVRQLSQRPADAPYFEYQVEQPVTLLPGSTVPRYPDSLRTAGVEGEVLAQFVVDAQGVVDVSTYKVLKANREEFAIAVRQALAGMRFEPARKDGRAVKQLVQQPFMFKVAK